MNTFQKWAHGLGAAFITGAASAISLVIVDFQTFDLVRDWKRVLAVAVVSGVLAASAYLKQSPLP